MKKLEHLVQEITEGITKFQSDYGQNGDCDQTQFLLFPKNISNDKTIGNPAHQHRQRTWIKETKLIIWLLSFQMEKKKKLVQVHFGVKKDLWNPSPDRNISEHCTLLQPRINCWRTICLNKYVGEQILPITLETRSSFQGFLTGVFHCSSHGGGKRRCVL